MWKSELEGSKKLSETKDPRNMNQTIEIRLPYIC